MRKYHFLIAVLIIAFDRVTKWTIARKLSLHDSIQVIPGFFRIIHTENRARLLACSRIRRPSGKWAC